MGTLVACPGPPSEPMDMPDVDFRLWDEQRVNAYKQNVGSAIRSSARSA